MNKTKPELLAPAGSVQAFKAAILAGADAIYLAGKRFGARAFAANFDESALRWARRVTKSLNKKLYITLNTLVFDDEWRLLEEALDFYEALQPDALIIQDLGVAVELSKRGSRIARHLSTQGTWFGQGGEEQLKKLGITRVILPRELTAHEIKGISQKTNLELEMFVHGAMCYSISGRCYWSASLGTRSGNRGTCAQPCRKEYKLINQNISEFAFSPKDLRLIDKIKDIVATGVTSIKIEGRMKSPEYVYQVVSEYRKALDLLQTQEQDLSKVFTRAFSDGFFTKIPEFGEWQTKKHSGREGQLIGITTGKIADGLVEIQSKLPVLAGDGLVWQIENEEQGSKVTWIKTDKKHRNTVWLRGLPLNLGAKVSLYKTSNHDEESWLHQWNKDWERLPIDLYWSGHNQTPLAVEAIVNEHRLRIQTDELLCPAMNYGLKEGPLQEKFTVLGDLYKAGKHITSMLDDRLHISTSALKRLKRNLVESITKLDNIAPPKTHALPIFGRIAILNKKPEKPEFTELFTDKPENSRVRLKIYNKEFPFSSELPADSWMLPWHSDHQRAATIIDPHKITYWLPPILNANQLQSLVRELKQLQSGEFYCFGWEVFELSRLFPKLKFNCDWYFNICNLRGLDYLRQQNLEAVLSKEWQDTKIPNNLNAFRLTKAYNPLVSFTRFPLAISLNETATNSHRDNFFMLPLGNGVEGLFLKDAPTALNTLKPTAYQIEVAIPKNENPAQAFNCLSRILM